MRKNSPRKWVHAILDLLPLLVIPIFAIYSQRHVIENNSVVVDEPNYISVRQGFVNGLPNNLEHWRVPDETYYLIFQNNSIFIDEWCDAPIETDLDLSITYGDVLYFSFDYSFYNANEQSLDIYLNLSNGGEITVVEGLSLSSSSGTYFVNYLCNDNQIVDVDLTNLVFFVYADIQSYFSSFNLFNLTQIFGSGNEPSANDFYTFLNNRYLPYGEHELQYGTKQVSYNDTDIGSQFIYQMYNVTDKYFNFNQLFNMGSVYDWLNTNMFGGNAPLIVPIVWNIIVYELFMDIIFLFYAVFMFIVDFATNMVDSFLHKSSKGRY